MKSRRTFLKYGIFMLGGLMLTKRSFSSENSIPVSVLFMPEESGFHERTWMAFVANDYIWSKHQISEVKRNLVLIANTIAKYEPVSMLVSHSDYEEARALLGSFGSRPFPIELIEFEVDDLWLRDTGPTFVTKSGGEKIAIDFNFNGWGGKQEHNLDKHVAKFIAKQSRAMLKKTDLVLEGGCFEVDGHGTAILTKSCVLNKNRNPHLNQCQVEQELKALLGLKKIIWLEGIKGKDITDGHTDFYARFTRPGEVIVNRDNCRTSHDYKVTRQNISILQKSTDVTGNKLKLSILDAPEIINEQFGVSDFAAGYIGYYVCNGAVISQKFGDKLADEKAKRILQQSFPERIVEQIAIDGIASGGGSIHCATQQEVKV